MRGAGCVLLLLWLFGLPFLFLLGIGPYNMEPGDSADWAFQFLAFVSAGALATSFVKYALGEFTPTPTPKAQPLRRPGDKDKKS